MNKRQVDGVYLFDDTVKQLAAADVVKHEVELVRCVEALFHANNVLVANALENIDFSLNHVLLASTKSLVNDLACEFLARLTVLGEADDGKVACSKLSSELVGLLNIRLGVACSNSLHAAEHLLHHRRRSGGLALDAFVRGAVHGELSFTAQ